VSDELRQDALELITQVRKVRVGYTGFLSRSLDTIGLNVPQYTALAVLDEKGEVTMGVLAEGLGITMGAVTNIVDRLIDAGLATRDRGTEDRRIVKVRLTDKGRDILAKAIDIGAGYFTRYLGRISPEERKPFIATYRKLADLFHADLANLRATPR
jgi:DNA-binding MarR family transcriptional regulator